MRRAVYETKAQKTRDFLIGFIGWFIFNVAANGLLVVLPFVGATVPFDSENYAATQSTLGMVMLGCNIAIFLLNIGALIYFGLTRYWIAIGALSAFGTLLVLAICAAIVIGGVCFAALLSSTGNYSP